jgi:hypothetical protein
MNGRPEIGKVLGTHSARLMTLPGVLGTGEGVFRGRPCILVFVERYSPDILKRIPRRLDGFAVVTKRVGKIRPSSV